ncbi:DUF2799 domain-containing protein [Shewanella psychropiezotolerans]|uniref:DUF2799 domain-containing protein n=1 Tax=Shewanella psychropiezotolerans TaxID=2593655 RepID=A0ABX5WTF9_9GAMM|nr:MULTISPECIES: DUF2799 domain-containing protein [Shewanella]MPY25043.1 DUF2799 domain-containing protein [Shewanella sp. YLB-07]QDO82294.1 DUF2799 domain-containing protein [Shewanella psychropiezotolerans]
MKFKILAVITALSLTQCTSMNMEQCQLADWYSIGMSDGNNGAVSYTVNDYIKDCNEFGLAVNSEKWTAGYQAGLKNYCQTENGYKLGLQGAYYNGVCSNNEFLKRYNEGHRKYEIKQRISSIESRLKGINHEITSLNKKINAGQEVANNKEDKKSLKREENKLEKELMLLRIGAADILPIQFIF